MAAKYAQKPYGFNDMYAHGLGAGHFILQRDETTKEVKNRIRHANVPDRVTIEYLDGGIEGFDRDTIITVINL